MWKNPVRAFEVFQFPLYSTVEISTSLRRVEILAQASFPRSLCAFRGDFIHRRKPRFGGFILRCGLACGYAT